MSSVQVQLRALIKDGLTFSDCVRAFGVPSRGDDADVYAAAARRMCEEGKIEVDDITVLSETATGYYVMAWLWVGDPSVEDETDV